MHGHQNVKERQKTKYIFLSLYFRLLQNSQWRKVEISITRNCITLLASEHYIVRASIMPNSFCSLPYDSSTASSKASSPQRAI